MFRANVMWDDSEPSHLLPFLDVVYWDKSFGRGLTVSLQWLRLVAFVEWK